MQSQFHKEYLKLIKDTSLFIQNQLRPGIQASEILSKSETIGRQNNQNLKMSPFLLEVEKSHVQVNKNFSENNKKVSENRSLNLIKNTWELQTIPIPEENFFFREKLSEFGVIKELQISVFLVLPEENVEHRLFLENVSRAITRIFGPACVVLYSEKFFKNFKEKILLIPIELLNKSFPQVYCHQVFKMEQSMVLPLEPLDTYVQNPNSKRALWKAIQHLFQS